MPQDKPVETPAQVEMSDRDAKRGRLKVFLAYAPGVGKTYSMLDEAQRRRKRGQDVAVGTIDLRSREGSQEVLEGLEVIPPRKYKVGGQLVDELDVDAVIRRKPHVVLIDDLHHTNVPGSPNDRRWQDVEQILDAGIGVLTSMNVQHLESLNDRIQDITGMKVQDTVPDQILHEADEVEMVDVTPRALMNRLERGDLYPEKAMTEEEKAWFKEGTLSALREIALREIASRVDEDVIEYRRQRSISKPWATQDKVLICISPSRPSLRLVRRGWRIAQKMQADVTAVYVEEKAPTEEEQKILRDDFDLAERLGIKIVRLQGNVVQEILRYARENNITQLVIGHSQRSKLQELRKGSIIGELARELRTIDILVVAAELGAV